LQETWPERLRTKGAGILQAAFSGGFVIASVLWIVIGAWLGGSWRWMYAVGIVPALFVALLARDIPESAITPVVFLFVRDPATVVVLQIANGFLTGGLYGWFAVHPPELFPTSVRSTAISLIFNFARFLAMFGPILASSLIGFFGGYGPAPTTLASIFALGLIVLPLLPETKGQPLPV
jgi:MFS family permease